MATKKKGKSTSTSKKNNKIKSEKKKIDTIDSDLDSGILSKVYIIVGVLVFICLFYSLTLYITGKNKTANKTADNNDTEEVFSYSDIMVGRSFSISDGEYYVIYYDKSDEEVSSKCSSAVSNYSAKEDSLDIYTVDMSNGLNKKYSGDESNTSPTNASEIVINGPTLIKFDGNEVVDYIEGVENITSNLE